TIEVNADNAADQAIQGMRFDRFAGLPGSSSSCPNTTAQAATMISTSGPEVWCQTDPTSAQPIGLSGGVPASTITTLCGEADTGNTYRGGAYLAKTPATADLITPGQGYWDPFCTDYHDYSETATHPDRCEAGLFVGRATSDTTNGGLLVEGNLSSVTGKP